MENKRELLLKVFRDHQNAGYVPCFFTDVDMIKPPLINERPVDGTDGFDWFGVEWKYVPQVGAPMVKPGTKVLTDITKWREQVHFPDLDALDWPEMAARDTAHWDRENKLTMIMLINGPFERTHALMGFEDALAAMLEEPEEYQALVDAITDYKVRLAHLICQYYQPDIMEMHDDFGANDRMLMSPDTWRQFFKEPTRRIIQAVHEHGILYEHHSCGYIAPIFDELVELGIDAIDPLQATNPIRELKDKYQSRVTFVGGYDTMNVFDRVGVTEEEIRQETRRTMDLLAPGGSFVAFPLTVTRDFAPIFIDEHMKHAFSYGGQ